MVDLAPACVIGRKVHIEERANGATAVFRRLWHGKPRHLRIHDCRVVGHSAFSGVLGGVRRFHAAMADSSSM